MHMLYEIALTLIKGIGPALAKNLIAYTGSAESIFKEKEKSLEKIPGIGSVLSRQIMSQKSNALEIAENELIFIEKNNIYPLYYLNNDYPFRLKECADSPILLYSKGNNTDLNEGKFVSIVGTRKATETGKENCSKLVKELSDYVDNLTIISGLAYGIDIHAHKSALKNKLNTIGVLAHGLDRLYPSAHISVAKEMQNHGGLLSEFKSGTNPDKPNFVQRNRIIAGLCDATIVVESKKNGGAVITANMANEYNRDVFAFPGRITDEFSQGCNELIKNNKAYLIESAEDVMQFMNWDKTPSKQNLQTTLFVDLNEEEQKILELIKKYPYGIQSNEIAISLALPFSKISSLLLEMEFKNLIKCLPGNQYSIIK